VIQLAIHHRALWLIATNQGPIVVYTLQEYVQHQQLELLQVEIAPSTDDRVPFFLNSSKDSLLLLKLELDFFAKYEMADSIP
jgi:hypothetical protein